MNRCQNPLCSKPIPAWKKFCSSTCRNAVAQREHRRRQGKAPVQVLDIFKKKTATGAASVERLKKRSLLMQEKAVVASVQAPPPESPELTKAIAEKQAREAEWRRDVEEKVRYLVAQERSIRNLKAVYESGTTFEMARRINKFRSWRKREGIKEQNSGMFLSGVCDGPNAWYEWAYAREFLEKELAGVELKCEHGKSWCEDCELCDVNLDLKDVVSWDAKEANTVLAKLGLSVWAGKSKHEGYSGEGRAVDGIEARSHNPRPWGKINLGTGERAGHGNASDSFEKTGEQAPECQGQADSRPDPNYTGVKFGLGEAANAPLESCDNPQTTQADVIAEIHGDSKDAEPLLHRTKHVQDFVSPEAELARLDTLDNRTESIEDRAHERIKESSTEVEVERIIDTANREIAAAETALSDAISEEGREKLLPEEQVAEPEPEVSDDGAILTPEEP